MGSARYWAIILPIYICIASAWVVNVLVVGGNISLTYLVPGLFVTGLLFVKIGRTEFLEMLGRVRVEFCLLLVLVFFSVLSLFNSQEPFRAFRILFPSLLPMLIFLQLMALSVISRRAVSRIPRAFLFAGLLFSVLPMMLALVSPTVSAYLFSGHRLDGFFENPNQHSIVLATILPLLLVEVALARRGLTKLGFALLTLMLVYTLIRTGSKTALLIGTSCGWGFYLLINLRSYSPLKRFLMTFGMLLVAVLIAAFGLDVIEAIDPVLGSKLRIIFSDGVSNYYSIRARAALWDESIAQGSRHWLIGSGAGEQLLGHSHSHNLVLDYFRGIGVFGAAAIALLSLTILLRAFGKGLGALSHSAGPEEKRAWACYAAAVIYVLCNQLSDCFGPSTIATLWLIYLPAVMAEPVRQRRMAPAAQVWRRTEPDPDAMPGHGAFEPTTSP